LRSIRGNGKMMFLLVWEVIIGSREKMRIKVSKPFTKENGSWAKDKDLEHSTIIMAVNYKEPFQTT
jgi:hypothetical protein